MKAINLIHSRLALPMQGVPSDISVAFPEEEEVHVRLPERGRIPFLLRGSIILILLAVGVVMLGTATYYAYTKKWIPNFSGKSRTEGSEGRALGSSDAKASMMDRETDILPPGPMFWKTTSPSLDGRSDRSPPVGPVSPSARRPIGVSNPVNKPSISASSMSVEVMKSQTAEKENSGESKSVGVPPYVTRETARVIVAPKTSGGSVTVELSGVAKKLKEVLSTENKLPMRPNELSKTPVPKVASRKRAPEPRLVKAEAVNMDHYSIQVAACRRTYCVSNYTGLLKDKGFEPITKKTRNGKLILIMTGTYRTLRAAKPDLESLKERGFKKAHAIKR